MAKKRLIDLYAYRMNGGEPEFLLFKRAGGKIYEGQWRMIGGKVQPDETYWEGALRELREETGLTPKKLWTIPSVNTFYEHKTDSVHHIPAFAAELSEDQTPVLDDEHSRFEWFSLEEAVKKIYWPEQIRLMRLTNKLLIEKKILEDWIVSLPA
jgi:dihydroneopterin triphosphate diphosphatase